MDAPAPQPDVDTTRAVAIAAKEAELEAAKQRFQREADWRPSGGMRTKSFGVSVDANLRRAGEASRDVERLERELEALRRSRPPAAPQATQADIDSLEPGDLVKLKNGLVYKVVKVNKSTVKVAVPPGMDDLMPKSKIVRTQKANVTAPKSVSPQGGQSTVDDVRDAIARLTNRPGGTVRLTELRDALGGRLDVGTLRQLDRDRVIQLEPDPDRAVLSQRDRDEAIDIGGQPMHLVRLVDQSTVDVPADPTPTQWVNARTGALVANPGQVDIVRGNVVKADSDEGKAAVERRQASHTATREANLKIRAQARAEGLRESRDPKDNAAKVRAIQDGNMHSADLYRTIMAGPSGQKAHVFVGRVRYTPNRQEGEFEVIDTSTGERAGWMSRTVRNGEQMYVLYAEDYDGGIRLVGWTDTASYGADVLVNGSSQASTRGTLDARRLSGGKFEAYVPKSLEQLDREMEQRDQLAAARADERAYEAAVEQLRDASVDRKVEDLPMSVLDKVVETKVDTYDRRRAYAEKVRRQAGIPFREGQEVWHPNRGKMTYLFPDETRASGDTSWVRFDDGNEGMIPTNKLSATPLDTSRVKRDDGAMTTTAAPKITEPTIGVTTSSKGRTTTVTLPDGTVATRTSKTREYTHAVVATRDMHQRAQLLQAETDRRQAFVDALQAWVDAGSDTSKLKAYPSRSLSLNDERAGKSRNEYYLPGFEPVRESVRRGRDYWNDPMGFSLPNFKDTTREGTYVGSGKYTGPELTVWERYGPSHVLDRQRAHIASNEKQAAELNAGPRYKYEVIRWSGSRDNAQKAANSEFSNPWTTYRVIGVGDDITGQTADESKPVKVRPTAEEKAAAKAAKTEQESADRAKRRAEFIERITKAVREADSDDAARSNLSLTEAGVRALALDVVGIRQAPRGLSDREKMAFLKKTIIDKLRGQGAYSTDGDVATLALLDMGDAARATVLKTLSIAQLNAVASAGGARTGVSMDSALKAAQTGLKAARRDEIAERVRRADMTRAERVQQTIADYHASFAPVVTPKGSGPKA